MDIEGLLSSLTLEEKCRLLVGCDAWHTESISRHSIPSIMMADGPHGLRKQLDSNDAMLSNEAYQAVCFPPAVTVASSFDPTVIETMASAIADECLYKNVQLLLGPGLNIKRSPLCGRNFEYYSEDPLISGEMAAAFVRGLQTKNVGACLKHFALNSQETFRMIGDSIADKRAFYELYTAGFKRAIKEQPDMVMCSYNKVDGTYASENSKLLKDVLRNEYGFDKVIVSDWTAVNDRSLALKATLDLEMPGHPYAYQKLMHDYHINLITMDDIDASVRRILALVESKQTNQIIPFDLAINHQKAYEIAKESFVLLKNEEDILPLKSKDKVAFIGALARQSRYQGGGSSHIHAFKVDHIFDYIQERQAFYAEGYTLTGDGFDESLILEAKNLAQKVDKVVVVVGLTDEYESEGYDRTHLNLPDGQIELIKALVSVQEQIVVVLQTGSPVVIPMIERIKGVLNCYLMGEAGAKAAVEMLYGQANPSGRLAETFPLAIEDTPSYGHYALGNHEVHYQESLYVGYRYYSSLNKPVLFPFGYGLSYTTFSYNHFKIKETTDEDRVITVSVEVTNTGYYIGKEVVQLYVRFPSDKIDRPIRELKAFSKVLLDPNETKTVELSFETDALRYYDDQRNQWVLVSGDYGLSLMKNAVDCIEILSITIKGDRPSDSSKESQITPSYHFENGLTFNQTDFESRIQRSVGSTHINHKRPFTLNHSFSDIRKSLIGGILYRYARKEALKSFENQSETEYRMIEKSLAETPLRAVVAFSGGRIKMKQMQGLLELINHRFFKAIKYLLGKWS